MIRLRTARFLAFLIVGVLLLTGSTLLQTVIAQEGTPESEETATQATASPEPSPSASPVATEDQIDEFLVGAWRIALVSAKRQAEFTEFELPARPDKDWVVVIADITNWSRNDEQLDLREFALDLPGPDEPRGFARRSTEATANILDLEPEDVADGVDIDAGQTERVVMVFEIPTDVFDPALFLDGVSISLAIALEESVALDDLPPVQEPGETSRQLVADVISGNVIALGAAGEHVTLSFVDAPVGEECLAEEAAANLRRIATERVYVEQDGDLTFVWTEEDDGTRRLLNYEQVEAGFAGTPLELTGRFALWFADGVARAKLAGGGVWGQCTGPHGVARSTAPERSNIRISDGSGGTTSYRIWLEWSPELVTTPDGGAWAFFSALADNGPLKDQQRLYASRFDPTRGRWLDAMPMPAGEIQFGATAVVDSKGLVHVVYSAREFAGEDNFSTLIYIREDGHGGWERPSSVSLDLLAGHQLAPSLAIDAKDKLYLAWQDQRVFGDEGRAASPLNADVFVSEKEPNGRWSTPVLINNHYPTSAALLPRITVDGDRLVAIWSVYTSALGPDNAARMEWATRALDAEPVDWSAPQIFANGRGDEFGGRFVDMATDPTGGVVVVYARRGTDTFLFLKRLPRGAADWGSDTLIAFGDRGSFPTVQINDQGTVYVAYNAATGTYGEGSGILVDIGATAISYRSLEPGAEVIVTRDDPNSQGRAVVAIDLTGKPWFVFFGEIPGFPPTQVGALRNANVPIAPIRETVTD